MDINTIAQRAQGFRPFHEDPEARRDLPMLFRWKLPPDIRDCTALPWNGDAGHDHALVGIVAEAMAIASTDLRVSVSLRREWYSGREAIVGAGYTYRSVRAALADLEAGGWLHVIKGKEQRGGSGIQTVFWPTPALVEYVGTHRTLRYGLKTPIIVRDANGSPIPTPDHRELARVLARIERRNEAFAATDLRLDAPDVPWTPDAPMKVDGRWYDPRKMAAHVVYNVTPNQGGRLYGLPYQTLSNRKHGRRAQLTINGSPVEEPDFAGHHPTLLYHERGLEPDGDLYDVSSPVYGRSQVKIAAQVLINATGERNGLLGFCYRMAGDEAKAEREAGGPLLSATELDARANAHMPDAKRLFDSLKARHAPIRDAFFTGVGIRLQNVETGIMTKAALACLDRGIVVYPMHDSAMTTAGRDAQVLREAMERAYVEKTGRTPKIG